VSVTLTSRKQYVPCSHKPIIRTSFLSSVVDCGLHVPSLALQHRLIFGSWLTAEGVNAFDVISQSSSRNSLWRIITRPPFAHENAWHAENTSAHRSEVGWSPVGVLPYRIAKLSQNSSAESSVSAIDEGRTESQAPVSHLCWTVRLRSGDMLNLIVAREIPCLLCPFDLSIFSSPVGWWSGGWPD
jgi:hypothetical protein